MITVKSINNITIQMGSLYLSLFHFLSISRQTSVPLMVHIEFCAVLLINQVSFE